jgi:hypothetical protein
MVAGRGLVLVCASIRPQRFRQAIVVISMLLGLSRLADVYCARNKMVSHEQWLKACAPPIDVGSAGNGSGTTGPPKSPTFLRLVEI